MTTDDFSISKLNFSEHNVGKSIKSSKIKYKWDFEVSGKLHQVELFDSKISGKKKVVSNGKVLLEPKKIRSLFSFSFSIDTHEISLLQIGKNFECRINNLSFNHLIELQKNRTAFPKNSPNNVSNLSNASSSLNSKNAQDLSENKENLNTNEQYKFEIKSEKESENQQPSPKLHHKFPKDKFLTVSTIKDKRQLNENLLDFSAFDGSRPSKINIWELSLHPHSQDEELNNTNKKIEIKIEELSSKNLIEDGNRKDNKLSDINDLFETINLHQPKKEKSKLDKLKETYQSTFTENEVSKIDPIYNVFGGTTFNIPHPFLNRLASNSNLMGVNSSPTINTIININNSHNLNKEICTQSETSSHSTKDSSKSLSGCIYPSFDNFPLTTSDENEKIINLEKKPKNYLNDDDIFNIFN